MIFLQEEPLKGFSKLSTTKICLLFLVRMFGPSLTCRTHGFDNSSERFLVREQCDFYIEDIGILWTKAKEVYRKGRESLNNLSHRRVEENILVAFQDDWRSKADGLAWLCSQWIDQLYSSAVTNVHFVIRHLLAEVVGGTWQMLHVWFLSPMMRVWTFVSPLLEGQSASFRVLPPTGHPSVCHTETRATLEGFPEMLYI